ncbi:hypothetical protein TorRG33x02_285790 [Trema orientale]|uniref:Uncharacterized protein n=1 Tax=Trema orientale TaxID=63057 RepID=A0A2P5CGI2_TREOI|nr:hypothetical protein TorRG33x02_285790 [Trema orientale]
MELIFPSIAFLLSKQKGISITFRKMDDRKLPYNFEPDPEMQRIKPLVSSQKINSNVSHPFHQRKYQNGKFSTAHQYSRTVRTRKRFNDELFLVEKNDFPPFQRLRVHI